MFKTHGFCWAMLFVFLAVAPRLAYTQERSFEIPKNSYAKSYGGWNCNYGYQKINGACDLIKVPLNAYLHLSGGNGWACNRGFRVVGDGCLPIGVPLNGYLTDTSYGTGWECNRGYRMARDVRRSGMAESTCIFVKVPENGYLNAFGDGWKCDRGYLPASDSCVEIVLPDNAHLNFSGNGVECNLPYQMQKSLRCRIP